VPLSFSSFLLEEANSSLDHKPDCVWPGVSLIFQGFLTIVAEVQKEMNKSTPYLYLLVTISIIFITSCLSQAGAQMEVDLHELAANRLKKMFQNASPSTTFAGDGDVVVNGQRIDIVPTVEQVVNQGERWVIGVRFDLRLDRKDVPRFTFCTVGIGDSKDEAKKVAVEEWLAYFGTSFVSAMLKSDPDFEFEGFLVHSGMLGIRGQSTGRVAEALGDMDKRIVSALAPILSDQSHGSLPMTLNFMIVVNADGKVEGECRKNDEVSAQGLSLLAQLSWPKNGSTYLLRKYYMLRRK
jgi:hypothetical protein